MPQASITASNHSLSTITKIIPLTALLLTVITAASYGHADNMSALIAQKSTQPELAVPAARIATHSTIRRTASVSVTTYNYNTAAVMTPPTQASYRYSETMSSPSVLPAFLSGNYDNVDSQYLPLLSQAETQSSPAAREVISMARKMALNERTIIKGGCWDYLNMVFNRAGVTRDTVHKGVYRQGPYANSNEIEIGDWLYYINHGYRGIEHSGMFVGWVDESAKQALILSYAGESRREPARYRVYDLSNVYQIMRPVI